VAAVQSSAHLKQRNDDACAADATGLDALSRVERQCPAVTCRVDVKVPCVNFYSSATGRSRVISGAPSCTTVVGSTGLSPHTEQLASPLVISQALW
jgi:hypothetical protein